MRDYLAEGVCPDCEDPNGFDTCSVCARADAEGFYDDDGYEERFCCHVCARAEAEASYEPAAPPSLDLPY